MRSAHWDQHTADQAPWKLRIISHGEADMNVHKSLQAEGSTMFVPPGVPEKNFFLAPTLGIRSVLCLRTDSLG